MGLTIDIAVEHEAWDGMGDLHALAKAAGDAVLAVADADGGAEWSIVLADDAFVRELNARWRHQDRPTNVLSFPAGPAVRAQALGDVVVAWETSMREASERGWSGADYLVHLLVHGLCHLLGFDHESDDEAVLMETVETRALARLGIASPFERAEVAR